MRSKLIVLIKYFVAITIVLYLYYYTEILLDTYLAIVQKTSIVDTPSLALMCLGVLLSIFFRSYRWFLYLRFVSINRLRDDFSNMRASIRHIFGICFLLAAIVPWRAGELSRLGFSARIGIKSQYIINSILFEKATDLIILILFGIVGFMSFPGRAVIDLYDNWVLLSLLMCSATLGSIFCYRLVERLQGAYNFKLLRFFFQIIELNVSLRLASVFFLISLAVWCVQSLVFYVALHLAFPDIKISAVLAVIVAVNLSGLLNITPANVGIFQGVGSVVLALYDYEISEGLAILTLLQGLILTVVALNAFVSWLRLGSLHG